MKTKIVIAVAILFLFLLLIQLFRYEVYISADGETVMRLDRITGRVERCRVGC